MRLGPQKFGKRESYGIHGSIALKSWGRTFCTVIMKRNNVLYLNLAENVTIPFRFRIVFDFDGSWVDCEFKSQIEGTIVAQIVGSSTQHGPQDQALNQRILQIDEIEKWKGANK